jgi:hypothetical protein
MRIPSCGVDTANLIPVRQYPCGCAYLVTGERVSYCVGHQSPTYSEADLRGDEWMSDRTIETDMDARMAVAMNDVNNVNERDASYGSSWKRRGGVGAFMMMARKWDRIENIMKETTERAGIGHAAAYDVFQHLDLNAGGVLDDFRDLRRYLLLIEAELLQRGVLKLDEPQSTIGRA